MPDYHLHLVFATGLVTLGVSLILHCFFMFMALRAQIAFRTWFPAAKGAGLVVPSMLLPAAPS